MSEQKLKHIGPRERVAIALTTSSNRRARENWQQHRARQLGPGACTWCGKEACGELWTRPGEPEPGGERCCERCDHAPVEGWQHTHTAFAGEQAFPLCALVMKENEVVYLRRDGVVQFLELRTPAPRELVEARRAAQAKASGEPAPEVAPEDWPEVEDVPSIAFLGRDVPAALHFAGEGGDRSVNLWQNRAELDPVWLPVRMQAAVARDEARKARRRREREEREAAHDRKVAAMIAEEERKRQESIEKRALAHETRIVMDEITVDDADTAEEALAMPAALGELAELVEEAEAVAGETAATEGGSPPAAPSGPIDLRAPAPVKKGPGRPKRSARQRRARERQKRAWARQEAKNRLEVKRLQRQARNRDEAVIKEDS